MNPGVGATKGSIFAIDDTAAYFVPPALFACQKAIFACPAKGTHLSVAHFYPTANARRHAPHERPGFLLGPFGHLFPAFGGIYVQAALSVFWFVFKIFSFLFLFIWVRSTLPRFRYDQLMSFGWKFLMPVAMLNILATALWLAYRG